MNNQTPSILSRLRSVTPLRTTTLSEALRIAELQANKLIEAVAPDELGVDELHIRDLPRVVVTYESLPVSGTSHWNGHFWVITINKHEPLVRQRFTLLHEFKHVIDHGKTHLLYTGNQRYTAAQQAELAADFFAGCALVPKRQLKRAWGSGIQRSSALAEHFSVSVAAIDVRLAQTGLALSRDRCARTVVTRPTPKRYFRIPTIRRSYA